MGLPHVAYEDDEFAGYHIPKGTLMFTNFWTYSRNPELYPDPETFNPDRFIKDGKLDPGTRDPYWFIFGLGRRACPGRHLADASPGVCVDLARVQHHFAVGRERAPEEGRSEDDNRSYNFASREVRVRNRAPQGGRCGPHAVEAYPRDSRAYMLESLRIILFPLQR
ncbi:cytochrome P450 [Trametes polyzona]|nr:cytochrome P450 [Trametes polyzona]